MPHPPLDERQTAQALNAYITAREQAVRFVLAALDPTAYNAPALPYSEVLTRVQALIATEIGHYAEETPAPDTDPGADTSQTAAPGTEAPEQEDPAHG